MLREMKNNDLKIVSMLEQALFSHPWEEEMFAYELHDNPYAKLYVWEEEDEICGYIDYWITFERAQLANLAVRRDKQRQGSAKAMMEAMIQACERAMCENITLEVRMDNHEALALYEHYGFLKAARRKGYYEDGTDAHLMIKPLGGNYV